MFNRLIRPTAMSLRRVQAPTVSARRQFSADAHHPTPEYTGLEKAVRTVFPKDWQLARFLVITEYGLLFLFLFSGGKKKEEPVVAASGVSSSAEVPSMASEEFDEWSKIPGNMAKWEASLEDWAK